MIRTKQDGQKIRFYWSNDKYIGYAYKEVCGFYGFVFEIENNGGCWFDYALRAIADKLTELNKDWAAQIDIYFKENNHPDQ